MSLRGGVKRRRGNLSDISYLRWIASQARNDLHLTFNPTFL